MSAIAAFLIAPFLTTQAATAAPAVTPLPAIDEIRTRIERNDSRLFWGFFEGCDPDAVGELLHPDYRMIHDLAGMPHDSAEAMVGQAREHCARRAPGGDAEGYRNRRLLVPGSRSIERLGDWGALEEGYHTFHEWSARQEEWVQTGGGRYLHVWQWMPEEGRFRLLESLSIDHGPAPQYPPVED